MASRTTIRTQLLKGISLKNPYFGKIRDPSTWNFLTKTTIKQNINKKATTTGISLINIDNKLEFNNKLNYNFLRNQLL